MDIIDLVGPLWKYKNLTKVLMHTLVRQNQKTYLVRGRQTIETEQLKTFLAFSTLI